MGSCFSPISQSEEDILNTIEQKLAEVRRNRSQLIENFTQEETSENHCEFEMYRHKPNYNEFIRAFNELNELEIRLLEHRRHEELLQSVSPLM